MTLTVGSRLGSYEILGAIGAGGMGEVYKARDIKLRRDVALKVLPEAVALDEDRLARFAREARVLASLNHPHIAQIYGLEEAPHPEPGRPAVHALAMELVAGTTVEALLASQPRRALTVERALTIASQIAEALAVAHEKGIVHRDLKPGNVMVTADGTVKVLDFGLAKAVAPGTTDHEASTVANSPTMADQATDAGVVLGTAAYMSPEQARGLAVDKRADLWAFGCVLYEMLSGRRAFHGDTVTDTLAAIMRDPPNWTALPSETPRVVRWILERCLEKDARQRLQNLGDVRLMLGASTLFGSATTAPVAGPPAGSTRAGWVVATIFALALAATGLVAVRHLRETPAPERVALFTVPPPDGTQFPRPTQLAVSPDGRFLIFSLGTGSKTALWIRPVQSLTARPLTGTEGAILPFWSPDGRAIGFFSSGKLMTVPIDGGTPTFVCNVANGRGGTWNRDNVIVFSASADAPLQRVPAAGGTPTPATTLDPPRENSHRMPSFLPDGRHFLYLAGGQAPSGGIAWQIKVGSLDGSAPVKVGDADINGAPVWSAGHILFGRNRSLLAVRFDPVALRASGAPFAVTDQPVWTTSSSSSGFAASPDGLLALVATTGVIPSHLTWIGRDGKTLEVLGNMGASYGMALAPDERRVALSLETGTPRGRDIWLLDLAQNTRSKLTVDPADETSPLWTPDGLTMYFASTRNGAGNIFRKAADGHGLEELVQPSDRSQYPSAFSKDGKTLVFVQVTTAGTELWALSLSGETKPWPIVQGGSAKTNPDISPDGHWLAYQSNESGREEVYVVPFPKGGAGQRLSTDGGRQPVWSADGKELFFVAGDTLNVAPITITDRVSLGPARALVPMTEGATTAVQHNYAVAQDGRRILTIVPDRTPDLTPITVVTNWLPAVR